MLGLLGSEEEIRLTKYLINNTDASEIFFDVGANCGYYSLLVRKLITDGEVHSFEPAPAVFEMLERNCLAKGIVLNQLALFSSKGELDFFEALRWSGWSTFDISTMSKVANPTSFRKSKVRTCTLDNYCQTHCKPTFLKIDVEGAEQHVIEGGLETLRTCNPVIAMEVWRSPLNNTSHLKAMEILYELGYKSYSIDLDGCLEIRHKIDPEHDISEGLRTDNFIFKK
ncbi:MAG: FkbM family methyltransferase [Candidatus Eisenbacteria bacterium]|nr:FkbM family methyltransferase [Candidatus Eisenbacteria bacterium]